MRLPRAEIRLWTDGELAADRSRFVDLYLPERSKVKNREHDQALALLARMFLATTSNAAPLAVLLTDAIGSSDCGTAFKSKYLFGRILVLMPGPVCEPHLQGL